MKPLLQTIQQFDTAVFDLCTGSANWPNQARIARKISRTGDGPLYAALALLIVWLDLSHSHQFLYAGLLAFAFELPVYLVTKNLFKRNRPAAALPYARVFIQPADTFSFPSGHTAAATLMAVLVWYFYTPLAPVAFCWAALIGLSRLVLGVHFPTDILAGIVLGSCAALASIALLF